jgi:hypothetical protein
MYSSRDAGPVCTVDGSPQGDVPLFVEAVVVMVDVMRLWLGEQERHVRFYLVRVQSST